MCLCFSGDPPRLLDPPGHLCGWVIGAFFPWGLRDVRGELVWEKIDGIFNLGVWVPEGTLAARRHLALELVSGADFWCKLVFRASPGDLGASRGRFSA